MDPMYMELPIALKTGYADHFLWTQFLGNDRFLKEAKFPLSLTIMQQKWGMAREIKQLFEGLKSHDSTLRPCVKDCSLNVFCTDRDKLQMVNRVFLHEFSEFQPETLWICHWGSEWKLNLNEDTVQEVGLFKTWVHMYK